MSITPTQARQLLITVRGAFALAWLAPVATGKLFGFRRAAATDSSLPFLVRLFAARDGVLGFLAATAPPERRRQTLAAGVAVDAADLLAAGLMWKDKRVPRITVLLCAGAAASAVTLGVLALQD